MSAIRLCSDCKHFIRGDDTCAKSPVEPDYVYGRPVEFYSAQAERETINGCSPEARWFEHKDTA